MGLKLIIAGASGAVGQDIVPPLLASGCEIIVVGRDKAKLQRLYPDLLACDYSDLEQHGAKSDLLINLAVMNNNSTAQQDAFDAVNVELPLRLATLCRDVEIPRMIQVSSVHALQPGQRSEYAISKRKGAKALDALQGVEVDTVYLGAVHGAHAQGKLGALNKLPTPLRHVLLKAVFSLSAVVSAERLVAYILGQDPQNGKPGPRILVEDKNKNPIYRIGKRALDLLAGVVIVGAFWWLLLLVWAWVRLDSHGPGLFAQERIGRHGKPFICYKFRTMAQGTKVAASHEVSKSTVTRAGAILRRTKLDELPQVLNIFRNEISLVGPRPCLPSQTELIEARDARGVLDIKPGITGFAQIHDVDMSEPQKLARWDATYTGCRGLLFDLKVILATVSGKGQGDRTR